MKTKEQFLVSVHGSRGIPGRYGGFETLAEQLASHGRCQALIVICPNIEWINVNFSLFKKFFQVLSDSRFHTPIISWITRQYSKNCDAVLVVNPINVLTALAIAKDGPRVCLNVDGMEDQRQKWGFAGKLSHKIARLIAVRSKLTLITDSSEISKWYLEKYGRQTLFIPYGGCQLAEDDAFHRWDCEDQARHFLLIARPEPENQIIEICRAFLISRSKLPLIVVGSPKNPTKYWRRVLELIDNSPRILLAGSIYDRQQRCDLYLNAQAVIHGHTVGGTNPSLVDALSHGCPVLAHDNPFNREVAGSSALYWKTEDELALLLDNDSLVYPQIDTDQFIKKYNWADVTNRYFRALGLDVKT